MYSCYIVAVFSVFVFLYGFFPITRSSNSINNEPPTRINNISFHPEVYAPNIEKVVLIVIDALRLDFVNTQYMPLTTRITREKGCFHTVVVETPTVTLPRIKAMTAGNVPQFMDLVLNLASTEILQDSLIHSVFKKGKRIVFYGDDTWVKLFPNYFARHDGTSSFFVRDFKEVDNNVTRNINTELEADDWNMMILHYLGLDHIGHVYGPFSSHIPEKLKEMDEIIYSIYSKLPKDGKTSIIITGDHGMRDSGGHGGSSYSETHVPFLTVGLQCINGSLHQIDIPINIAVLLGVNIPSTCIGQIRPSLLPVSLEKYLFSLRYNNLLLLQKANLCEDHFYSATKFHEMYIKTSDKVHASKAIELYKNCSNAISDYLIKSSVNQNFYFLIVSILVMFNIVVILIRNLIVEKYNKSSYNTLESVVYFFIVLMQFILTVHICSVIFIMVLILFLIKNVVSLIRINKHFRESENVLKLFLFISIIHPLTFLSSSFVEEEHQFWYFFYNTLIVYIILTNIKQRKTLLVWLGLSIIFRFVRRINSTGDKWASYPDISDWFLRSHNYYYYQLFFIFGLLATLSVATLFSKSKTKETTLNFIILTCVFVLKNADYENVSLGKLIWFLILIQATFFYDGPKIVSWILVSSLLLKPYNVILIPYCILVSKLLFKSYQDTTVITYCHFMLGNVLYFAQGHSNSLASVDVSVGYIGLSEYQPVFVFAQVLCHTYALPVLCHFLILLDKNVESDKVWTILFCNRLYIMVVTGIITVVFRHHLFIWSVFAPKLFIESIHLMFLFAEFCIYSCFKQFKLLLGMFKKINKTLSQ